jgi:hypothetical protein
MGFICIDFCSNLACVSPSISHFGVL